MAEAGRRAGLLDDLRPPVWGDPRGVFAPRPAGGGLRHRPFTRFLHCASRLAPSLARVARGRGLAFRIGQTKACRFGAERTPLDSATLRGRQNLVMVFNHPPKEARSILATRDRLENPQTPAKVGRLRENRVRGAPARARA